MSPFRQGQSLTVHSYQPRAAHVPLAPAPIPLSQGGNTKWGWGKLSHIPHQNVIKNVLIFYTPTPGSHWDGWGRDPHHRPSGQSLRGSLLNWGSCLSQTDVDSDLVGDVCDTNEDRWVPVTLPCPAETGWRRHLLAFLPLSRPGRPMLPQAGSGGY